MPIVNRPGILIPLLFVARTGLAAPPAEPAATVAAPGGLTITGNAATLKLGFLLQSGYEYLDSGAAAQASQSIFLRRARLLLASTVGSSLELFAEVDAANVGRSGGLAPGVGVSIQDAFATWRPREEVKLDVGMMLIALSHNSVQGAATLYGWEYFASSFQQSTALGNYVGRDNGAQLRGLLLGHLEYRLGLFTGKREAPATGMTMMTASGGSRMALRTVARLQYNVLDPETGYFYAGTYCGAKRVLSFGAGMDHQGDYTALAGDGFLDLPLGGGVLTAQVAVVRYDGGTWIALPRQTDLSAEAGFLIGPLKLSPIVRVERQVPTGAAATALRVTRLAAGLAWWPRSHTANVKVFWSEARADGGPRSSQLNAQVQLYVF
jgi:hypothetical protein